MLEDTILQINLLSFVTLAVVARVFDLSNVDFISSLHLNFFYYLSPISVELNRDPWVTQVTAGFCSVHFGFWFCLLI